MQGLRLVLVAQLAARRRGVEPARDAHRHLDAVGLQNLPEAVDARPARPLEAAVVHRVPRDEVDVRRDVVLLEQPAELVSLHACGAIRQMEQRVPG